MKTRYLFIAALLASNTFTAWMAWSLTKKTSEAESSSAPSKDAVRVVATPGPLVPTVVTNVITQPFDWRQVESADYRQYLAKLRAIGCPEETIRDIIVADVNKLFAARAKTLRPSNTNQFAYWKPVAMGFGGLADQERVAQQQELTREKRALLKELLGVDVPEKPDVWAGFNPFDEMLSFLPAEKQTAITEVEQKLTARQASTMSRSDFTTMRKAYTEREAELAQILTPEEKFEYDLRTSPTAQFMRMKMGGVEFTEPEFRDLFKLQKQFDDEFGLPRMRSSDPAEVARRNTAQNELDYQFKSRLGEARYQQLIDALSQRRGLPHGGSH